MKRIQIKSDRVLNPSRLAVGDDVPAGVGRGGGARAAAGDGVPQLDQPTFADGEGAQSVELLGQAGVVAALRQ